MLKKIVVCAATVALAGGILAGCGSNEAASSASSSASSSAAEQQAAPEVKEIEMKKISPADVEAQLGNDEYLIVDVRKAADFEAGHIPGAISADMDAAKEGDLANGIDTMKASMQEATGTDNGADKKLVLVCYSGNRYAQVATNILGSLGANMDNVTTLEGGMKAWTGETEK